VSACFCIIDYTPYLRHTCACIAPARVLLYTCIHCSAVFGHSGNWTLWTRLEPVQSDDAVSVAKALLRATNGRRPVSLRSDGGPSYANAIMESVTRLMGVTQLPHVHTGNSVVERCNKEVLKHVSNLVLCDKMSLSALSTWGTVLPLVENIINNSFHSAIGMAPAQLWFGREFVDCATPLLAPVPVRWHPATRFPFASFAQVLADNQTALYAAAQAFAEDKLGRYVASSARSRFFYKRSECCNICITQERVHR
jgi:hypothetical protein